MTTPRVTVITPCFNAGDTLAKALASLRAQTMANWECVVIDDGSPTPICPIVEKIGDRRIRLVRFARNRGRSVARQKGLEMARGRFICMLDADDWYYPDKLAHQLAVIESRDDLAAVGMSLAVVDGNGELTGIRQFGQEAVEIRRNTRRRLPDIGFPPIMLRRRQALRHRFDPRLRRAQDADYLMRVLADQNFAVMRRVGYAYHESWSPSAMRQALLALGYQRTIFVRDFRQAPLAMVEQYAGNLVKTGIYRAASAAGGGRWLFERRNRAPTRREERQFSVNHRVVARHLTDARSPARSQTS